MSWIYKNNIIIYENSDGSYRVPPASEIYSLLNSESTLPVPSQDSLSLKKIFPNIRFSKIGTRIGLILFFKNDCINCRLFIKFRGTDYTLENWDSVLSDHCIINNTWLYFTENYQILIDFLSQVGIQTLGTISFSRYLTILSMIKGNKEIPFINSIDKNILTNIAQNEQIIPKDLNANLYPYQKVGFEWLKLITNEGCGCIIADEMGLGKTIQIIAILLYRKSMGKGPSIVVAPVSLLENWRREILKFAPSLSVLINHGTKRTGNFKFLLKYDVVIISYSSVISDSSMLAMIQWDLLIADEAQYLKNPFAERTTFIKQIPANISIAVTGTPFENHMSDIWSISNFVMPTLFGNYNDFMEKYGDNLQAAEEIEPILSSIMLRRKVCDVAKDLPEKVIITQPIAMSYTEAEEYERERNNIIASYSGNNSMMVELTKLRMFCAHPSLVNSMNVAYPEKTSTKYERLLEILFEILSHNEKAIIFTSFIKMSELIQHDISHRMNIPVMLINGETPVEERQKIIDLFSSTPKSSFLVINPKAAGVGLNITAANHVIHYNLEWNPALEDQATSRVHRHGQGKTVFVHRLFYSNTVEEFVNSKIERKRELSQVAVIGNDGNTDSRKDILAALQLSPLSI